MKQFCPLGHDTFVVGRAKNGTCRECVRIRSRKYYRDNIETKKLYGQTYAKKNRTKISAWVKDYYLNNPEKLLNQKEQANNWKRENRQRWREAKHRRKAKRYGRIVEKIDYDKFIKETENICGICKLPIDASLPGTESLSLTIDHIIPIGCGGNHTKENIQLAHYVCNVKKNKTIITHTTGLTTNL